MTGEEKEAGRCVGNGKNIETPSDLDDDRPEQYGAESGGARRESSKKERKEKTRSNLKKIKNTIVQEAKQDQMRVPGKEREKWVITARPARKK